MYRTIFVPSLSVVFDNGTFTPVRYIFLTTPSNAMSCLLDIALNLSVPTPAGKLRRSFHFAYHNGVIAHGTSASGVGSIQLHFLDLTELHLVRHLYTA
jgi:hypothetical protein